MNMHGELIGVNSAMAGPGGAGHIPVLAASSYHDSVICHYQRLPGGLAAARSGGPRSLRRVCVVFDDYK
jgi:hypothetical protein